MAEEPQPASVQAGSAAAAAENENPGLKPASKDDAKAAAALDSLDARGEDAADGKTSSSADAAALSGAMNNLKVDNSKDQTGTKTAAALAREARKSVKIDTKDVAIIVEYCELRKDRATDLLKDHGGDLKKALAAYVTGKA